MRPADAGRHRKEVLSRFLSRVLRHEPESIGLTLDGQGWASIDELVACSRIHGVKLTRALVLEIVETRGRQHFSCDTAGRIRANHGHTIPIDLGIAPSEPPSILFHGTAAKSVASIRAQGLKRGRRLQVHLSVDAVAAASVGQRHGWPVVLRVAAGRMWRAGFKFVRSASGVWLTHAVPAEFIYFPNQHVRESCCSECAPPP